MDSSSIRPDHKRWVRMFDVREPRRHKKGFTVYRVTYKVFPMLDPAGLTTLTVWKRYNDFKQLHSELEQIHRQLYLPGKFPVFPKGNRFNRFDYEVIEERMQAALSLLQFLGNHVQLFTTRVFNRFFEEGYDSKDLLVPNYNPEVNTALVEAEQAGPVSSIPVCLVPEIVWTQSPSSTPKPIDGGDSSSSIVSVASEDEIATDSDSLLSGSIFSSVSKSTRHDVTQGAGIPKSQSELVMPTFLSLTEDEPLPLLLESSNEQQSTTELNHSGIQSEASPCPSSSTAFVSSNPISLLSRTFGILDFLPKFPKRDKEVKVSEEKLLSQALSSSYICEAAGHFAVAQDCESNGKFEEAFSSYKEGIRILLGGAKNDEDMKRKALVKKKLEKYLSRAEIIHDQFVSSKRSPSAFDSPIRKFSEKKPLQQLNHHQEASKFRPFTLDDLNDYKIIRIIDTRIYLAVDVSVSTKTEPRCYAIKVLPFSSDPIELDKKTVIPDDIPFMVKLLKWFETDSAYILLLQYAGGGKLIDYVKSYEHKQIKDENFNNPEISCLSPDEVCIQIQEDHGVTPDTAQALAPDAHVTDALDEQENSGTPSSSALPNGSILADSVEVLKIPRLPLAPQNQNSTMMESVVPSKDKEHYTQTVEPNTLHPESHQACSTKSSSEDLIECSKELLESVNKALEKVKRPSRFAGEFLSKSLENVSLFCGTPVAIFDGEGLKEFRNSTKNVTAKAETDKMMIEDDEELPTRTVPEGCIKGWAAEIIMFLSKFHSCGLIYGDLGMKNILLGENGHILVSFKAQWSKLDQLMSPLSRNEYSAPEVVQNSGESCWKMHPSCDFWSLGAILFELFTGQSVHEIHPEGFHPQTVIRIPSKNILGEVISSDIRSLLTELLEVNPSLRLGFYGAEEVKSHPCFDGFDWELTPDPRDSL